MAEIVVEVHDQEALAPSSAMPTEDLDVQWIEVDGRRFTVSDLSCASIADSAGEYGFD